MTAAVTLDQLEQSAAGLPLLGFTVSWRLSRIKAQYSAVAKLLEDMSLAHYCPEKPSDHVALRRAIVRWAKLRAGRGEIPAVDDSDEADATEEATGKASKALIRKMKHSKKSMYHVFALVQEEMDFANLGIQFGTLARILLNKGTKEIQVMTEDVGLPAAEAQAAADEADQMTRELGPLWTEERDLLPSTDVSRIIRRMMERCEAVSLRSGGGYYFVPASRKQELQEIREVLSRLDPTQEKTFMIAMPVIDTEPAKKEMGRAAFAALMDEIRQLEHDLIRTLERENKPETLEARLRDYNDMKLRVEAFSVRLGVQQTELMNSIERISKTCRQALMENVEEQDDQPAVTPPMHRRNDFDDE
jgi:hypothetical protein